jgi:hypothetical protein
MQKYESHQSHRKTPWDGKTDLTPTQAFLKRQYQTHYEERHRKVSESGEADIVNSFTPSKCPFCGSEKFWKSGHTASGVQRYKCVCGRTFLPTTGTIFNEHKISISEWMEYCLNLFRHVSITADSWNNKNAFTTSRYWLEKLFITLADTQSGIVLSGEVWLDETFYTVRSGDVVRNPDGSKLSGVSRNQICIGVATDKTNTIFLVEGLGKSTQRKMFATFGSHIAPGSTLYHDKDNTHRKLVETLSLTSVAYASKDLKGLPDSENPLEPVNCAHRLLKKFLRAHSGFKRESLQGYLDLFAFAMNPPSDMLEKVEKVVNLAFQFPKSLSFRKFYGVDTGIDDNYTQPQKHLLIQLKVV